MVQACRLPSTDSGMPCGLTEGHSLPFLGGVRVDSSSHLASPRLPQPADVPLSQRAPRGWLWLSFPFRLLQPPHLANSIQQTQGMQETRSFHFRDSSVSAGTEAELCRELGRCRGSPRHLVLHRQRDVGVGRAVRLPPSPLSPSFPSQVSVQSLTGNFTRSSFISKKT